MGLALWSVETTPWGPISLGPNKRKKPDRLKMRRLIRTKNFYLILMLDASLVVAAYLLAYLLRFEGQIPQQE